ncbi:MAG: polymerase subunit gamma/tau, partial [Patescibacteria group bacterium]|nr:polymerase subunit gamma/tau [Patescibacteria group bacterium]
MSSRALYRKYRSKSLQEVVGQQHIVQVLDTAIKNNKISHAYLFTGPRGVGKTSIARIFAHQINQIEYKEEATNLDIIEIDAASNSGVDDMRDLKDKIGSAPASLKFKVYIIDEVHMLSGASFAALLKTIEEPPSHAVFILATTDAHKVPSTIMSRVQKFYFKPIDTKEIEKHLSEVCKEESIVAAADALGLIAESAEGSMRDALSLLDQVSSGHKEVTLKYVQSSLGLSDQASIDKLALHVLAGKLELIPGSLNQIIENGADPRAMGLQIYQNLKSKISSYEDFSTLAELLTVGSLSKPVL